MNLSDLSSQLSQLVKTVGPSVVMVDGGHRRGSSGLVWSADGVIVTAAHKLVREEDITVGFAGAEPVPAELVGADGSTDVAVLRVRASASAPGAPVAEVAPAPGHAVPVWSGGDDLEVGALALAIARPGRTARASLGIVSTLSKEPWTAPGGGSVARYIETDIGGRPGFSGGALVDASGKVIGMSTGGLVRGASMAVPHATLSRVVTAILGHGRVPRGWLGVGAYPVELPRKIAEETQLPTGLVLVQIAPDGPAERAGLIIGDVLLSIDGKPLPDVRSLQAALVEGQELSVRLLHAGKVETRTVQAGSRS